ncbi:MAG: PEP-CTERM sorting domain-containing protein [Paucibacter sp.]|nr:PEP-CTERM sorting domain-containing protein [Roseateles sp.]
MKKLVIASLALISSAWSHATPDVVLSFTQPTAAPIGAHDPIPLWLTVSVPAGQSDFVFDPNAGFPWGFAASDIPTTGFDSSFTNRTFTSYSSASIGFGETCTDGAATTMVCNTSPYGIASGPGFQSIADANGLVHISAGSSVSVLAGTFYPSAAGAVPGQTYNLFNAELALTVTGTGLDGSGNTVALTGISFFDATCPSLAPSCTFTRTIAAVPEPGSWGLLALGLGGLAWELRRRRI